jgi:hypothetical protein
MKVLCTNKKFVDAGEYGKSMICEISYVFDSKEIITENKGNYLKKGVVILSNNATRTLCNSYVHVYMFPEEEDEVKGEIELYFLEKINGFGEDLIIMSKSYLNQ